MNSWTFMLILTLCVVAVSTHNKIRQKRTWIIDSFTLEEENPGPFPYVLGKIHVDKKYLVNFILSGGGVDVDPKGVLSINSKTGEILVHKKVDHEAFSVLRLSFEARNVSNDKVDTRLGVEVKIHDINDHAPVFTPHNYETTINESLPQGKLVTTVFASDGDDASTPNGTFTLRLVSATPKTDNIEFYLTHNSISNTGSIFFKGCVDYEKAPRYTLLIEAKDNGEKVQLSSTTTVILNIVDHNNHLPEITGHTGSGKIKEQQSGVEVLRLQVTDRDTIGSPGWRAKYTLHGDKKDYFKIQTDPITNEGILTVIKAMDYEEQDSRNVSIGVENEVPYFFCKVKKTTSQGLWDVETLAEGSSSGPLPKLYPVTIAVEDINDPPEFVPPVKNIMIMENTKVGTLLDTLTAKDPDKSFGSSLHFYKGEDKDNLVNLDSKTGQISVAKILDRESPFVKNSTYSVIVYVKDNAEPPLTGTGTVILHLGDQNDNVPLLVVDKVNVCYSDKETMIDITAEDPDLPPYSAPFHYELLGDAKEKWKIEPKNGTAVNLVRGTDVYSGHYKLQIKIADNQGYGLVQNLSVTVCDCTSTSNCHVHRSFSAQPSLSAIGIIIFALLILLALLLLGLLISCGQKKTMIPTDDIPDWNLINFNIETPGTDCKMPAKITQMDMSENIVTPSLGAQNRISTQDTVVQNGLHRSFAQSAEQQMIRKSLQRSSSRRSYRQINNYDVMDSMSRKYSTYYSDDHHMRQALLIQLDQRFLQLQTPQEELSDYKPHCHADEGEYETDQNLDAISIPEIEFHPDILTNLDFQFNKLAVVCRPDLMAHFE